MREEKEKENKEMKEGEGRETMEGKKEAGKEMF